tara:strand:- start:1367 stop:1933 length:567 start_codon:yes stop_codon:yes gene_type:complete
MKEKIFDKKTFLGGWYIPTNLCDDMIQYFKSNKDRQAPGRVGLQEINTNVKASTDLQCSHTNVYPLSEYRIKVQECMLNYQNKYPELKLHSLFNFYKDFLIQHYKPGQGYKTWHSERMNKNDGDRFLVFMTYLNDVKKGGTYFKYQNIKVPAKKGLTLIWPTDFTHTHKGIINMTKEKYIATGWIHFI